MKTEVRLSALERLADAVGIVPRYLDQTGTEWRETTAESRIALLAAMGIDASSEAAAESSLRDLRMAQRRELLAPVRVVEHTDDTATRHVAARTVSAPNDARWRLELTLESGDTRTTEGRWPTGTRAELPIPWPEDTPYGYHRLRLHMDAQRRERDSQPPGQSGPASERVVGRRMRSCISARSARRIRAIRCSRSASLVTSRLGAW